MKAGSLVKIVDPFAKSNGFDKLFGKDRGNIGKSGIVLSGYQHATAHPEGGEWYMVLVEGEPRQFREDYLEAVR